METLESHGEVSPIPVFYNQEIYSTERMQKIPKGSARSLSPNIPPPNIAYKKLFDGSSIESSVLSKTPLNPELKETYDRMLIYLEKLFKERFRKIRDVVYKLHSNLSCDEILKSYFLSNDPTTKNLGVHKYKEILENTFASEREAYIERLAHEVTILNEK